MNSEFMATEHWKHRKKKLFHTVWSFAETCYFHNTELQLFSLYEQVSKLGTKQFLEFVSIFFIEYVSKVSFHSNYVVE